MSNSAAVAMAAALNHTQQVTGNTGASGFGVTGSLTAPSSGSTLGTAGSLFSSSGLTGGTFGVVSSQQQPFSVTSSALGAFGSTSTSTTFGTTATVLPFGASPQTPATGFGGAFALQKTPSGSKRGKNA